ncbi:MAG: insulinase family protein [Myxococcales bacterium]|nr:insulinase family protein [Myxococcales bacterium]
MRRSRAIAVCLGLLALTAPVAAEQKSAAPSAAPEIPFEKYQLANGLEVILHRDSTLPLVAVSVWYHVGPINEPAGRSGFAHLFEHLMFTGSKHVGQRFDQLLESAGATNVNGTTSWDRTNYFETVPREQLELCLWIESDRMGFFLDTLSSERLEVQRGVVKNERRQSYEDSPYGPSSLALLDTLFPTGHPYHGAVIGSMADLDAAKLSDAEAFFRAYYAPSNATLTLAGDFDPATVKLWLTRYFGGLAKKPKPSQKTNPTPALTKVTRVDVTENVELAKVSMGFITPPAYSPDSAALELTAAVLAGGKATRLYKTLVVEKKVASDVEAELDPNALAGVFSVSAVAASGKAPKLVETTIDEVLTLLASKGPTDAELERARRRVLLELSSSLQLLNGPGGESGRAGLLQRFNQYVGDPGYLKQYYRGLEAVTRADVARVAREHLALSRRVIVTTLPRPAPKPEAKQPAGAK